MKNVNVKHKLNCIFSEQAYTHLKRRQFGIAKRGDLEKLEYLSLVRETGCGVIDLPCLTCYKKDYSSAKKVDKSAEWILENEQEYLSCLQWEFINNDCFDKVLPILDCTILVKPELSYGNLCNVLIDKLESNELDCKLLVNLDIDTVNCIISDIQQSPQCTVNDSAQCVSNVMCDAVINYLL